SRNLLDFCANALSHLLDPVHCQLFSSHSREAHELTWVERRILKKYQRLNIRSSGVELPCAAVDEQLIKQGFVAICERMDKELKQFNIYLRLSKGRFPAKADLAAIGFAIARKREGCNFCIPSRFDRIFGPHGRSWNFLRVI